MILRTVIVALIIIHGYIESGTTIVHSGAHKLRIQIVYTKVK